MKQLCFKMLFLSFISLSFVACQKDTTSTTQAPLSELATRGKGVYLSNCIACHHPDPKLNGSIGPAVYGSSLELLTKRIMEAKYPEGYKPKRESAMMPAFPQLKNDLESLHAYLNSQK